MTNTFTLNNETYRTDAETVEVLRSIMPSARKSGDSSAVVAVIALGQATGRIEKVAQLRRADSAN